MGLTRNGRAIGMAAHIERLDFRRQLTEAEYETRHQRQEEFVALLRRLRALDPIGWEAWYDDPRNVPDFRYSDEGEYWRARTALADRVVELERSIHALILPLIPRGVTT